MADGRGPGRITKSGVAFGATMAILIVVSLWLFIAKPWWFPPLSSIHGAEIDAGFHSGSDRHRYRIRRHPGDAWVLCGALRRSRQ